MNNMKLLALVDIVSTLAARTPPSVNRSNELAKREHPDNVRFCKYEEAKVSESVAWRPGQGILAEAHEIADRKSRVFNACMEYRMSERRNNGGWR